MHPSSQERVRPLPSAASRIVVAGLGNIGSHLVPHLARMSGVCEVVLIDKDVYDATNLATQAIESLHVGRKKAQVVAALLQRIDPALGVRAMTCPVEDVPLGRLRADLIVGCLDGRAARQCLNQAARALGAPYVDAGVDAAGLLARVDVYMPGGNCACMECGWDASDYELVEQTYPCGVRGQAQGLARTNAPSGLGALAAAFQALAIEQVLTQNRCEHTTSWQVVIDARHHNQYHTVFRRNPACRLGDHEAWEVRDLPGGPTQFTVGQALALGRSDGAPGSAALWVDGVPFLVRLTCAACGHARPMLRLRSSLSARDRTCAPCGGAMVAAAFDHVERLHAAALPPRVLGWPLRRLGLRPGDVLSIDRGDSVARFVIPDEGS